MRHTFSFRIHFNFWWLQQVHVTFIQRHLQEDIRQLHEQILTMSSNRWVTSTESTESVYYKHKGDNTYNHQKNSTEIKSTLRTSQKTKQQADMDSSGVYISMVTMLKL